MTLIQVRVLQFIVFVTTNRSVVMIVLDPYLRLGVLFQSLRCL